MSTTASSYPETPIWSAPSAPLKLHSRAREAEAACCAEFTFTKSLSCIEIPQSIYDSGVGLGLMSQDPIGFAAGDANLYRYVGNGPTNATDPSGLDDTIVPTRLPNAQRYPGFPSGYNKHYWPFSTDSWGLRSGLGRFTPQEFFEQSSVTMEETTYGCGGIVSMRVGLSKQNIMGVTRTKDSQAFGSLEDALAYLRNQLNGNGAIVVLQRNWLGSEETGWNKFGYETKEHEKLIGRFQIPANRVDPTPTCNFAILLGSEKDWYWEDATGPWSDPKSKVRHYQSSVTDEVEVVFIVVPNAASRSPVPRILLK